MLTAAGVQQLTLRRWVQKGLLPEPTLVSAGRARGTRNQWPVWALQRAHWIREQRARGVSVPALVAMVKAGSAPGPNVVLAPFPEAAFDSPALGSYRADLALEMELRSATQAAV